MAAVITRHHVTAILVAHDGATWIPKVIAALSTQSRSIDNSIAIDTGSKDETVKLLRSSGFKTINAPRGMGFGSAIEEALSKTPKVKQYKGERSENIIEWLWLIHDDCAPSKSALAELLKAVDEKPTVAIAGPKILGWYDRNHILELGVSIAPNGARWTGMEYREQDQGQHDGVREVLAVSTAGALIRRDVYEEIGGLDPNLALFRDDVDFGWRARTAGYSVIAVSDAVVYHAEAASSERRSVDVAGALLHRPLLLDRRNAAYVLLANASWWWLPLITIQLLFSALVRSIGFLFAKLPGYAADEIAAVGLLIIKPDRILFARKKRKKVRLLSSQIIKEYIPPRGSQISSALERARFTLTRYFDRRSVQTGWTSGEPANEAELTMPTIALGIEESDDTLPEIEPFAKLKMLFTRPIYVFTFLITLITIVASRNRLGDIAGGFLSPIPASGVDLLRKYTESWHTVGQGSSANASPWMFVIGMLSLITLGNLKLFFTLTFLLVVPILFVVTYKYARGITKNRVIALCGAALYSLSPALLSSLNLGAFGTIFIALVVPFYLSTLLNRVPKELFWRQIFFFIICDSLVFFFSPVLFVAVICWQVFKNLPSIVRDLLAEKTVKKDILINQLLKFAVLLVTPFALALPWSFTLARHPSRFLIEPGLQVQFNSPIWIIAPTLIISIIALFTTSAKKYGELAIFMIAISLVLINFPVAGHGNFQAVLPYTGSLHMIATFAAVVATVKLGDLHIPQLAKSRLNYRHFLILFVAILSTLSIVATSGWWVSAGAKSQTNTSHTSPLPAFVSASGETPERYKTLVLTIKKDAINYFIARDRSLELGDADQLYDVDQLVNKAVADLVAGVGVTSSQVFGNFAIKYLFLTNPVDLDLVRTIDGIGGFVRASANRDGISWKISGARTRITMTFPDGSTLGIPSGEIGAKTIAPGKGSIYIAEKFDGKWKLLFNGRSMPIERTIDGYPSFSIPEKGVVQIFHDGTQRRALISVQLIFFLTVLVLATPGRRRKREVPVEELA